MSENGPLDPARDARSVGELLLDADLRARSALWDPDPDQAKASVRAWNEVVDAAAQSWSTIPDREQDPTMERIHARARAGFVRQQRAGWPGGGDGDPLLEAAAASLSRAGELVSARRHPTAPLSELGHLDAQAARTRMMHTVYVASHAVALSLDLHIRELQHRVDARRRIPAGDSTVHARAARDLATSIERLAGTYLDSRWPVALTGEQRDPPTVARLQQAIVRWEVQAHRSLAGEASTASLLLVAATQRDLTRTAAIVGAAQQTQTGRQLTLDQARVAAALTDLDESWGQVREDLTRLRPMHVRPGSGLLLAGNELRAAMREITHDATGLDAPAAMAARVDLEATARVLHRSVAASPDLAQAVNEALQDPQLTVSARGAHAVAAEHLGAPRAAPWVDPTDVATRREVALPQPVRTVLVSHAERVVAAARVADSAAGAIQEAKAGAGSSKPRPLDGRWHRDRTPPSFTGPGSGYGCER